MPFYAAFSIQQCFNHYAHMHTYTHNTYTHNTYTHNTYSHNTYTHNTYTHNTYTYNTYMHNTHNFQTWSFMTFQHEVTMKTSISSMFDDLCIYNLLYHIAPNFHGKNFHDFLTKINIS